MKRTNAVLLLLIGLLAQPLSAAEDDAKAREQFDEILAAFSEASVEMLQPAIDKADLTNRVVSLRPLQPTVRNMFSQGFDGFVATAFAQSIHNPDSREPSEVVAFRFDEGEGQAVVREKLPNYRYAYLQIDLRHDRRGRLRIVDWFDSQRGQSLTDSISDMLLSVMPTKATTGDLLTLREPTDLQLFQATELLKAASQPSTKRFFEIYTDMDSELKQQPLIARFAMERLIRGQSTPQSEELLEIFAGAYAESPKHAAMISDFLLQNAAYRPSYDALKRFHQYFDVKEGSVPARLSALALALGDKREAVANGEKATANEPTFELGWWSLLRARAAVDDFAGCVEILAVFEDNFGERMDEAKLRRDPFQAFNALAGSDEFENWRATR